uniref:Uncharacterized protein n=1 Tax=viral metagenome TaxID=1070528 RepID=A0A6C0DGS8_9ZZZZ
MSLNEKKVAVMQGTLNIIRRIPNADDMAKAEQKYREIETIVMNHGLLNKTGGKRSLRKKRTLRKKRAARKTRRHQ